MTQRSSRLLGKHLGIGDATVTWRRYHVQPWRRETFKFSTDPQKELVAAIRTFIEGWNERCHPFIWTKTADQILPHVTGKPNSDAGH